ncbi:biotin-independent malonate decarboxylase subunit beta [Undibacterium sp. SXout7W]|uniref:biotin-independent malonate decarboxylase subunit beta n=1 Tax=Undibacterium sp. SXout7W TaxID=3413049 RepID=UPI003BF0DAF9
MSSYLEATARQRIHAGIDDFHEILPPSPAWTSPHLPQLNAPVSFDDGVIIGTGYLDGQRVFAAAQEGGFMGGAVGEVHGAKLVGLMRKAVLEKPAAVILLAESGGVRLHEANAGLIAVSEVMRALFDVRAAGIPVIVINGGSNGCFGGMGIVARCANVVIMSEEARLAMSGPEVIETANGVEEFDAKDRALVWRTTGGKHRYLMGDCQALVADDIAAFRQATIAALSALSVLNISDAQSHRSAALSLAALEAEQHMLEQRLERTAHLREPLDIWTAMGVPQADKVAMMEAAEFVAMADALTGLSADTPVAGEQLQGAV